MKKMTIFDIIDNSIRIKQTGFLNFQNFDSRNWVVMSESIMFSTVRPHLRIKADDTWYLIVVEAFDWNVFWNQKGEPHFIKTFKDSIKKLNQDDKLKMVLDSHIHL